MSRNYVLLRKETISHHSYLIFNQFAYKKYPYMIVVAKFPEETQNGNNRQATVADNVMDISVEPLAVDKVVDLNESHLMNLTIRVKLTWVSIHIIWLYTSRHMIFH